MDVSDEALKVARHNAASLGLEGRAEFIKSSWGKNITGTFDIILSNPPYIPSAAIAALAPEVSQYEPKLALDGGLDGLDCYRAIMPELPRLLAPGGLAAFEIGVGQEKEVKEIVAGCQLSVVGVRQDLTGIPRCILVQNDNQQLATDNT